MEQQLIDILREAESPEDIDEVSMSMINFRVKAAIEQLESIVTECIENVSKLAEEKKTEFLLADVSVIIHTNNVFAEDDTLHQFLCVGPGSSVLRASDKIKKHVLNALEVSR